MGNNASIESVEAGIPGRFEVTLETFHVGHPPDHLSRSGISPERIGYSYEEFKEKLGGDFGYLTDSREGTHYVSIAHWKDEDTSGIRFVPSYRFIPDEPFKEEYESRLRRYVETSKKKGGDDA